MYEALDEKSKMYEALDEKSKKYVIRSSVARWRLPRSSCRFWLIVTLQLPHLASEISSWFYRFVIL